MCKCGVPRKTWELGDVHGSADTSTLSLSVFILKRGVAGEGGPVCTGGHTAHTQSGSRPLPPPVTLGHS